MFCKDCTLEFHHSSQLKLRRAPCDRESKLRTWREYYRRSYVKKGHKNYSGMDSPNYINGNRAYAGEVKDTCEFCELPKDKLVVHHLDSNRKNNSLDNLSTLCTKCHSLVHERPRTILGRFTKKEK